MPTPAWQKDLIGGGAKEVIDAVGNFAEKHTGKKELASELEGFVQQQFLKLADLAAAEISARERIISAEMNQDDKLTKRMRPYLVGSGIFMALLEGGFRLTLLLTHTIPFEKVAEIPLVIPGEYWAGWTLAVGVWGGGRSLEKLGANGGIGKVTRWVTGTKKQKTSMLDD